MIVLYLKQKRRRLSVTAKLIYIFLFAEKKHVFHDVALYLIFLFQLKLTAAPVKIVTMTVMWWMGLTLVHVGKATNSILMDTHVMVGLIVFFLFMN